MGFLEWFEGRVHSVGQRIGIWVQEKSRMALKVLVSI